MQNHFYGKKTKGHQQIREIIVEKKSGLKNVCSELCEKVPEAT